MHTTTGSLDTETATSGRWWLLCFLLLPPGAKPKYITSDRLHVNLLHGITDQLRSNIDDDATPVAVAGEVGLFHCHRLGAFDCHLQIISLEL